jgi:hypothetical protein
MKDKPNKDIEDLISNYDNYVTVIVGNIFNPVTLRRANLSTINLIFNISIGETDTVLFISN